MIGKIVYDYALGMNGIVVGGQFTELRDRAPSLPLHWEWCVLYEDGEIQGADTGDLQEIKSESR